MSLESTSASTESEYAEVSEVPDETGESSASEGTTALHGAEDPREFRMEYPGEYIEPRSSPRSVEEFQDPRRNVEHINPYYNLEPVDDDSYNTNCADCARCYEATWRGQEYEAAGRKDRIGEASERTEKWAHEEFESTDAAQLRTALEQGGHGSSAIIHSTWEQEGALPGGHAYNVVNYEGKIITVDSQEGEVFAFSNKEIHPALEDASDASHRAMAWDSQGRRIL